MRAQKMILFGTTFALLTLFVVWYIDQERYIYFWDFAMYHYLYGELGLRFSHTPFKAVKAIVASIRHDDYNMLPTLFQMPFYFVFGSSRLAYILSITVLFAFPAIILFTRLMSELHANDSRTNKANEVLFLFIAVAVMAFSPQLWAPLLRGYVDVVGLNIIFLVLILSFRHDLTEQTPRNLVALGVLLSLLILLRRWYAYWVVGFFLATSINILVGALLDKAPIKKFGLGCKNFVIVGATAVLVFFVSATPIAVNMMTTNYREVYSAYRSSDSVFSHLGFLVQYFGLPFVVASGVGLVLLAGKSGKGRIASFIAAQFTLTFFLFTRTQNLGIHHYYWVSVTIFLLTAFFLQEVCSWLPTRLLKLTYVSVLLAASVVNFLSTFHEGARDFFSPVSAALPERYFYPLKRLDLDQVHSLLQTLYDLTRDSDGKIYVLTSSVALNGATIISGCHDFDLALADLERKLLPTHDVDKRDGLPLQFFQAQYVVVTNPVGYHLAPENQRVIGLLAEELLKGEGLGQSYERLPYAFALEDGSTAAIYRKNTSFKATDLKRISDTFVGLYPEYKEKFIITPEKIRALSGS